MAETNFTNQNESFPQKRSNCIPLLLPPGDLSCSLPSSPLLKPLKIHKAKGIQEQSRVEREHHKKRRVLEGFKQKITYSQIPDNEYVMAYLNHKNRQGLAAKTIKASGDISFSFLSFLELQGRSLAEISKKDIEAFIENYQDKGVSIGSVNTTLKVLYAFISFLVDKQVLDPGILSNKLKVKLPDPLPRAIDDEGIEDLLAVLDDIRERVMILLLLRTGMRIGEMLELQVLDINLNEQKISIYVGEKNYQGRVVYFSDDAKEGLLAWLSHRDPERKYLFCGQNGNPLSQVTAWRCITNCFKKAGLAHKSYSPHCLRHTFATKALNAGMRLEVVQQLLGHKDIEITRRYARLTDSTREEEYFRAMSQIEKGGKKDVHNRLNRELQAVFEKKKLLTPHN